MLRRSASARRATKSSATPTLGASEGRSFLGEHALYVDAAGPTACLAFIPTAAEHVGVTLEQVSARLPKTKGVANDLARRGIFAVCNGLANGVHHRRRQSHAQSFDFRHLNLLRHDISSGGLSKVLNV